MPSAQGDQAGAASFVLDIYLAVLHLACGKEEEAEKLFLSVLGSNPYIAGAWNDLGKTYYHGYRMEEAWQCWDTARRLCAAHPLLAEQYALERSLRDSYPDFF